MKRSKYIATLFLILTLVCTFTFLPADIAFADGEDVHSPSMSEGSDKAPDVGTEIEDVTPAETEPATEEAAEETDAAEEETVETETEEEDISNPLIDRTILGIKLLYILAGCVCILAILLIILTAISRKRKRGSSGSKDTDHYRAKH